MKQDKMSETQKLQFYVMEIFSSRITSYTRISHNLISKNHYNPIK